MTRTFDPSLYWDTVEDCLVEFHGLRRDEEKSRLSELHDWLDSLPPEADRNLIFNTEKFDLACELAGNDLPFDAHKEQYLQIVDRHYPGWRTPLPVISTPA